MEEIGFPLPFPVTVTLPYLELKDVSSLAFSSKTLAEFFFYSSQGIQIICRNIGLQYSLYFPQKWLERIPHGKDDAETTASEIKRWKVLLFDLLRARFKWGGENSSKNKHIEFKIEVGVRFKPTSQSENKSKLLLPLHQRLKIRKKGELLVCTASVVAI